LRPKIRALGHCGTYEFTIRPVRIANPCVFDKPLMLHAAVLLLKNTGVLLNHLDSMYRPVEIARAVFGQRTISINDSANSGDWSNGRISGGSTCW
jgi:hypothetical protein